ncbi:MAG TPA: hypothetical protein VF782_11030 [Allosphingosinicella sp.]|jgi:hypothetical protein
MPTTMSPLGVNDPWEVPSIPVDPANALRRKPANYDGTYDPQYASLVYVKFEGGRLAVKHAHFAKTEVDTTAKIRQKFVAMRTGAPADYYPNSLGENFDSWAFGSQSKIYIFIDNDSVRFDPENMVQFAKYSARMEGGSKPERAQNNTFLNPIIDTGIYPPYEVLVLENWYCDGQGRPIETENHEKYSMNIHLRMKVSTHDFPEGFDDVPLVLDPDTGNGGSEP